MAMGRGISAYWRSHLWWGCALRHSVRPCCSSHFMQLICLRAREEYTARMQAEWPADLRALPWLQAEAERFVTRPFLMGTHDAPQAGPSPLPAGAAQRASRAVSARKRATTSVFKPAQQCAPVALPPSFLLLPASSHNLGSDPRQ